MQTSSQFGNISLGGAGSEGKPGMPNCEIISGLTLAGGLRAARTRQPIQGKPRLCVPHSRAGNWGLALKAPSVFYPRVQEKKPQQSEHG